MARKTLNDEIQHDGGADTFVTRQTENLRHWAAPKLEAARTWGEYGAAFTGVGASVAAEEGRRAAHDAKREYGPRVEKQAKRAGDAVADRYAKLAPAVATGAGVLQDVLHRLQEQAQEAGHEAQKQFADARKDAEKAAKKGRKRGAKKAKQVRRAGRGARKDVTKAARGARKDARQAGSFLADRAGQAGSAAAAGGLTLAGALAAAVNALQEQGEKLAPQVQARLSDAGDYAQRRKEEVVPLAAARLADGAAHARKTAHDVQVPDAVEQALIALTGDKAIVRKLRKGAEQYAGSAEKDLNRAAGRKARSGGRGWILGGMALAAAGAGYALWRLTKPVQDPWTAPVPGPITANIPVVEANNPYAQQQKVVAESGSAAAGEGVRVDTAAPVTTAVPAQDPVAEANAKVLGTDR